MIDLDVGKLILLALIALVVLGPEKLPVAARTVGAIMRRMRNGWNNVRAEVERELQVSEIKQAARSVSEHVASSKAELNATVGHLREQLDGGVLDKEVSSTLALDKPLLNSSDLAPPPLGSPTMPSSDLSCRANASKDVQHEVT